MRNALINYFNRTSSNEQWWSKDDLDKFGKEFYPFLNKKYISLKDEIKRISQF